jgi:hypothetical protein
MSQTCPGADIPAQSGSASSALNHSSACQHEHVLPTIAEKLGEHFVKVGHAVRYPQSYLRDYIRSRTRSSTSEK